MGNLWKLVARMTKNSFKAGAGPAQDQLSTPQSNLLSPPSPTPLVGPSPTPTGSGIGAGSMLPPTLGSGFGTDTAVSNSPQLPPLNASSANAAGSTPQQIADLAYSQPGGTVRTDYGTAGNAIAAVPPGSSGSGLAQIAPYSPPKRMPPEAMLG